jgi:hypothetical protein
MEVTSVRPVKNLRGELMRKERRFAEDNTAGFVFSPFFSVLFSVASATVFPIQEPFSPLSGQGYLAVWVIRPS